MRDAKRKELQPPIQRSWLRLRAGKMYYAAKRYLLWYGRPGIHWAKERQTELLPEIQYQHATPLLRQLRGEEVELQYNKITNLKLAAARLNGVVLRPGETFSYWRLIGKPPGKRAIRMGWFFFWGILEGTWAEGCASCQT